MNRDERNDVASTLWNEFADRHRGHPHLLMNPLYTTTEATIDAIKHQLPRFFSTEDEEFERDLARTVHHGFRHKCPLGDHQLILVDNNADNPLIPTKALNVSKAEIIKLAASPGLTVGKFLEEISRLLKVPRQALNQLAPTFKRWPYGEYQVDALIQNIDEFIAQCRAKNGRIGADIQDAQDAKQHQSQIIDRRQEAFAGWLITNSRFRRELRYMQRRWGRNVAIQREFPRLHNHRVDEDPEKLPANLVNSFEQFCRRWCLRSLLSWDLPEPRHAIMPPSEIPVPIPSNDEGVSLFIPWSLLRGGQLDMREVLQRLRFEHAPDHLRDWLVLDVVRKDNQLGEIAYQQMFWIYRCHELVLLNRYEAKCKGNIEALDIAFGMVLEISNEQVRKLRQRLARERKGSDPEKAGKES